MDEQPMFPALVERLRRWAAEPLGAAAQRRACLEAWVDWILYELDEDRVANVLFLSTHNSRRSHFAQLWAQAAADLYGVELLAFSAGAEVTAVHLAVLFSLRESGFAVEVSKSSLENPVHAVRLGPTTAAVPLFSKHLSHPGLPTSDFAAVMVCAEADASCSFVPGASMRVAVPFDDPRPSDGTSAEAATYDACGEQIGREMAWVMARVAARLVV